MPPDPDAFFVGIRSRLTQQAIVNKQARFEESVIKRLLRYAAMTINFRAAREDCRAMFRHDSLSFMWFHATYPRFPMRLGTAKLRDTSGEKIGWTDLFGVGFRKLPWVNEYTQMAAQYGCDPTEQRIGLVFNVPRADGAGLVVFHNQPEQLGLPDPELTVEGNTRILRKFKQPAITYVLESFSGFLETVGKDWVDRD
jgi:hypothetical protein